MTLFFLILLTVSLAVFGFQRFRRKQRKLTIKPSLPKIEEDQLEQILPVTPTQSAPEPIIAQPKEPIIPPVPKPSPEPDIPIPAPEPIVVEPPLLKPEPVSLPLEPEPIMLSPKEPEPPGNLPVE